jgi:hypothetical protein
LKRSFYCWRDFGKKRAAAKAKKGDHHPEQK